MYIVRNACSRRILGISQRILASRILKLGSARSDLIKKINLMHFFGCRVPEEIGTFWIL
jgi:hypothetical protein